MIIRFSFPDKRDVLFYLAYAIFLTFGTLSTSFYYKYFIGTPYKIIITICLLLLIIREFMTQKYSIKVLLSGFVIALMIVLSIIRAESMAGNTVACVLAFMYCGRNVKFEDIARFTVWLSSFLFIFIILSGYLGIIDNYTEITSTNRVRAYLGFRYSLNAPALFFNIVSLRFYLKKNKIKMIELLALLAINFWLYKMTDSRLSFYMTTALIFISAMFKVFPGILKKKHKIVAFFAVSSFVICMIFSIYLTVSYDSSVKWQSNLNSILAGRLRMGKASLIQYGVSWFGQNIVWVGNGLDAYGVRNTSVHTYVDCFYIQILQRYGIAFTLIIIIFLTLSAYLCYKRNDKYLLTVLVFLAVHCVIDDLVLYLYYNTFWIAMGGLLFNEVRLITKERISQNKSKNSTVELDC